MIDYSLGITGAHVAFATLSWRSPNPTFSTTLTQEITSPAYRFASDLLAEMGLSFPTERTWMVLVLESGLRVEMNVSKDGQAVRLNSELAQGRVSGRVMRQLLEANFLKKGTQGATAGWRDGRPLLQLAVDASTVAYQQFRSLVEDFFNLSDQWAAICARDISDTEEALSNEGTSSQDSAFLYFQP